MRGCISLILCSTLFVIGLVVFILGNKEVGDLDTMRNVSIGAFLLSFLIGAAFLVDGGEKFMTAGVMLMIVGGFSAFIGGFFTRILNPAFVTKAFNWPTYGIFILGLFIFGASGICTGIPILLHKKEDPRCDKSNARISAIGGGFCVVLSVVACWLKFG